MYAQEMKNSQRRANRSLEEGFGDASASQKRVLREMTPQSTTEADDFLFGFGHYGDPHAFAPYQLILLFVDFAFNWSMDLAHEYPLAVLVIFVFQSLGMIINLILYIMASANQAMQSGIHKRVTTHHWMNLVINLVYMAVTAWLFIWALRNSWPSVSDEFSFTWPTNNPKGPVPGSPLKGDNLTRRSTSQRKDDIEDHLIHKTDVIKEHYTIWGNGFASLYVCHRTIAILYYFLYLRATFLVLNTSAIDRFVENKKNLVENVVGTGSFYKQGKTGSKHMRGQHKASLGSNSNDYGQQTPYTLGLDEYLGDGSQFMMENEDALDHPTKIIDGQLKRKDRSRRQILWADNEIHSNGAENSSNETKANSDPQKKAKSKRHRNAQFVNPGQETFTDDLEGNRGILDKSGDRAKKKHNSKRRSIYEDEET